MREAVTEFEHDRELSSARNSPQSRFVAPFVGFVAAFCVVFGLAYIGFGRSILSNRIQAEQALTARAAAQGIADLTEITKAFLQKLARSVSSIGNDSSGARALLRSSLQSQPLLTSISLLDNGGRVVATTEKSSRDMSFLQAEPCFAKITSGDSVCFSDARSTDHGGQVTYVFVPATEIAVGRRRTLVGEMPLETKFLDSLVLGLNPGENGYSYLVDRRGRVLSSGDPDPRGKARGLILDFPFMELMRKGQSGTVVYRQHGDKMMATYFPIDGPQWGLVVQRPAGESTAGTGTLVKIFFLSLIVALGGAAGVALVQTQYMTRFSFQLSTRLNSVARGNFDVTLTPTEEIQMGNVASSFNEMLAAIRADKERDREQYADVVRTAKFSQDVLGSIQDLFLVLDAAGRVLMANPRVSRLAVCPEPLTGRHLSEMGGTWSQRGIADALDRVLREGRVVSLNYVRFTDREQKAVVFDFRFYPLISPVNGLHGIVLYAREVTEQFTKQEKVQKSERFFRELSLGAGDGIVVVDVDLKVEWANGAASKLFGMEEDPSGKDFGEWLAADSRNTLSAALKRTLADGAAPPPFEIKAETEGKQQVLEISVGRAHIEGSGPRGVLLFRSVPKRRLMERESFEERPHLDRKARFVAAVVDAVPEAVVVVDPNGAMLMMNGLFEKLAGAGRQVLTGKKFSTLQSGENWPELAAVLNADGPMSWELQMRPLVGNVFYAALEAAPVRTDAGREAIVFVAREIGKQREADARKRSLQRQQTVEQTARDIARRLQPALNTLFDTLQELGGNIFSDNIRGVWQDASSTSLTVAHSVNTLMLYASPRELQLGECRMDEIIDQTLDAMTARGLIPQGIALDREYEEIMPNMIADAEQMKLVIWNLILNAVQASSDGGILVRALTLDSMETRGMLVEVIDDGPDFDTLEINRFFEMFHSRKPGHIGLGLPLCRRVVVRHGGRIAIERDKGLTRASFFVPLRPPQPRNSRQNAT